MKKDKCLFLMITVLLFIGCIQPKEKKTWCSHHAPKDG